MTGWASYKGEPVAFLTVEKYHFLPLKNTRVTHAFFSFQKKKKKKKDKKANYSHHQVPCLRSLAVDRFVGAAHVAPRFPFGETAQ